MNAEVEILIDQALDVLMVPNTAIVQLQDVGPAALALGLDVESMDLMQFMRAGRGNGGARPGGGAPGEGGAVPDGREPVQGESQPGAAMGDAGSDARSQIQRLRAQVEAGEITQDSMRALMQAMRGQSGGSGGRPAMADGEAPARETRPAVVFVMGADSIPEPRTIRVGLNDWDNTQVVSGLDGDEILVVVGAAQLQAQQQEWLNNIRSRMGGSPFGGGMGGRRGPR
jgi:HlyD family secretion protein